MSDGGIGIRYNTFDSTALHYDQAAEALDITEEVKVSNPAPIFVGTYSHVFRGVYNGETVAVKVLRPLPGSMESMIRKVTREREIWSRLEHPNIVPLCGYTEESELFGPFGALVSPWYPNGDSAHFLSKHGTSLTIEERILMWTGVVEGVCYLHHHAPLIVHGDIKPGNILIDEHRNAKICDFGLAHIFLEEGHSGMTTSSEHTGTERYLSYELVTLRDEGRPTTASDVWALACVGLEFLFLLAPYAHRKNNRLGLIFKDINDGLSPAGPPLNASPRVWELWLLLRSCWNPDPNTRVNAAMVFASLATLNAGLLPKSSLTTQSGRDTKQMSPSQSTSSVIPENESPFIPKNNVPSTHVTSPREWASRMSLFTIFTYPISRRAERPCQSVTPRHPRLHFQHRSRRFRNISRDKLNPIFMYWPENEPLPSIEQIRPSPALVSVRATQAQASFGLGLGQESTANNQMGDWDCGKCQFQNWRGRRVCASCYPYAESKVKTANHPLPDIQERSGEVLGTPLHQRQFPNTQISRLYHQQGSQLPINPPISQVSQRRSSVWRRPSGIPDRSAFGADGVSWAKMQKPRNGNLNPLEVLATQHRYNVYPLSFGGIPHSARLESRSTFTAYSRIASQLSKDEYDSNLLSTLDESEVSMEVVGQGRRSDMEARSCHRRQSIPPYSDNIPSSSTESDSELDSISVSRGPPIASPFTSCLWWDEDEMALSGPREANGMGPCTDYPNLSPIQDSATELSDRSSLSSSLSSTHEWFPSLWRDISHGQGHSSHSSICSLGFNHGHCEDIDE